MHTCHGARPDHAADDASGDADDHWGTEDHWEIFAESLDLTIEGQRLIAQEIGYEARLLWRAGVGRWRDLIAAMSRRRSSGPV